LWIRVLFLFETGTVTFRKEQKSWWKIILSF
jgi:hypothetical protein